MITCYHRLTQEEIMHAYEATLDLQLKALKLASFKQNWEAISHMSIQKNWSYGQYLSYLAQMELDSRESSRLSRHIKESKLPKHKTLSSFNFKEIPTVNAEQINALAETGQIKLVNATKHLLFTPSKNQKAA